MHFNAIFIHFQNIVWTVESIIFRWILNIWNIYFGLVLGSLYSRRRVQKILQLLSRVQQRWKGFHMIFRSVLNEVLRDIWKVKWFDSIQIFITFWFVVTNGHSFLFNRKIILLTYGIIILKTQINLKYVWKYGTTFPMIFMETEWGSRRIKAHIHQAHL